MKKFFKALALVLALTLVFGTIPASAAVNPDKVRKEKTLYVDGTKGKTADGVESQLKARTTYWRLLKIKKAEAKELGITATSADPEVIKTNDESMGVRAYAIGGSKEKPIVITLSDGKNLYKVNMIAKKSADTVVFGRDFADADKEYSINTAYELSLPRTVNGVKIDTDERRLIVKDADGNVAAAEVVEVKEDAAKPRLWTVKFLKAGTYTLVGEAFQSKKYDGTTAAFELEVTVKTPELEDIKQTAINAFQLSFNGDASAIDFKPQEIYYMVKDSVVPFSLLKDVKVNADDPTKVDVTMHMNFKGGETYYVKVGEKTLSFVACGTDAKDITTMKITTDTVEYGDFRNIGYKFYNKDDIDITNANLTLTPSFELTSNNPDEVVVAGTQIYFYEKGKTATIKGSVTTDYGNEANGYQPTVIPCEGVITSIDKATATFTKIVYSFEGNGIGFDASKSKDVHDYAIGDGVALNIWFQYLKADKSGNEFKSMYEEGITRVAVADENYGVVTALANNNLTDSYVTITGIKEVENIPVILYKKNTDGQEYAFETVTITLKPARKLTKAVLTPSKNTLNLEAGAADEIKLTLTLTDQYEQGIPGLESKIVMTQTEVTETNVGKLTIKNADWSYTKDGKYEYVVSGGAFKWAKKITDLTGSELDNAVAQGGSIVLSVKVNDAVTSNNAGIAIADKTKVDAVAYIPTLSAATLDTSVKTDTTTSTSVFGIKKSKAGYDAGEDSATFMDGTTFKKTDKTLVENKFYYTISFNGTLIDSTTNFDAGSNTLTAVKQSADNLEVASDYVVTGSAVKAKAGTYVFTLYRAIKDSADKLYLSNFGSKTCVVSDAQIMPTYAVETDVTTNKGVGDGNRASNAAMAKEGLKITWNGENYTSSIVAAEIVKSKDQSDYLKTVTVVVKNGTVGDVYLKIDVLKLFNGTNK